MLRTFNCGVGMMLVVAAGSVGAVTAALAAAGETVATVGELVQRKSAPVEYSGALDLGRS